MSRNIEALASARRRGTILSNEIVKVDEVMEYNERLFSGYRRYRHERPGPLFSARRPPGRRLRPHAVAPHRTNSKPRAPRSTTRTTWRLIPEGFLDPERTMVVYTPAVPQDHGELPLFRESTASAIEKRSQMLGHLAEGKYVMAVAGTHGKTTTSTLVAWLNRAVEGRRKRFSGRHLEELRQQSGAGRRAGGWQSRPTSSTARSCGCIPTWRWSRLGRCRPSRHLRHARGGEGGLRAVRAADPAGRRADHQAGRRHRDRQPRDHRLPLCLRRRRAISTPATCSCSKAGITATIW